MTIHFAFPLLATIIALSAPANAQFRANAWSAEQSAAFCLGQTEASLTYLVEVISQSTAHPTFDASPLKKAAVNRLTTLERLARHVADRGAALAEAERWALLEARQDGIHSTNQCYRDQALTYIPCQTRCQEQNPGPAGQDACVEKCELPKSCTTPPPVACNEFEATIAPR